ncbi:MAG: aminodeoxychorismate lyase [Gammaproteobacteria bacterium]|nr:aminodeoxychorismate lyase [Gammaproteobacteria bacterium]
MPAHPSPVLAGEPPHCWLNGALATALPLTDRALHYGDGLFATIAVANGQPLLLQRHLDRLNLGCLRLKIPPPAADLLQQELLQAAAGCSQGVIKLIVSRGSGGRGYQPPTTVQPTRIMLRYPAPPPRRVARIILCQTRYSETPALYGIKHLNRLLQVLARSEWDDPTIAEGLLQNSRDQFIEGTMSNLFWVEKGVLNSPDPALGGVAGVMRQEVLDLAAEAAIATAERPCYTENLAAAEEIFLTNSLVGILPVTEVVTMAKRYSIGRITQKLQQTLQQRGSCFV